MAKASAPECKHPLMGASWWLAAPEIQRAIEHQDFRLQASACYRLGDALLHVASDDPTLLDLFGRLYGDCAVATPAISPSPEVCCTVRRGIDTQLLLLTFQAGAPPDPAAVALSLLRATPVAPPYSVYDSPLKGWRLAGGKDYPVLSACDAHVLIDPEAVHPDFLVDYLVSITLATQPRLIVVHAASVCIGTAGVLLAGPSHGGKTTVSLHLAAPGHALLGDEAAVIRLASEEILPLRRAVNLRAGPRTPEFSAVLSRIGGGSEDGGGTRSLQIGTLFPGSTAGPVRLRAIFFLREFSDHPSLTPFRPTLHDADIFDCLAGNEIAHASWGLAPERRALRLLALRQMLSRVPCWLLTVGTPHETAELIERKMEELGC